MTNLISNKIKKFINDLCFSPQDGGLSINFVNYSDDEIDFSILENASKNINFERCLNSLLNDYSLQISNGDFLYDCKISGLFSIFEYFDLIPLKTNLLTFVKHSFRIEKYGEPSQSFKKCLNLLLKYEIDSNFWIDLWNESNPKCKYIYFCGIKDESLFNSVIKENNTFVFLGKLIDEKIYDTSTLTNKLRNITDETINAKIEYDRQHNNEREFKVIN